MNNNGIGKRITIARDMAGLSARELADRLALRIEDIQEAEASSDGTIRPSDARRFAEALGVSTEWLTHGDGPIVTAADSPRPADTTSLTGLERTRQIVIHHLREYGQWPSQRQVILGRGGSFSTISVELAAVARDLAGNAVNVPADLPDEAVEPVLRLCQIIRASERESAAAVADSALAKLNVEQSARQKSEAELKLATAAADGLRQALRSAEARAETAEQALVEQRAAVAEFKAVAAGQERAIASLQAMVKEAEANERKWELRAENLERERADIVAGASEQLRELKGSRADAAEKASLVESLTSRLADADAALAAHVERAAALEEQLARITQANSLRVRLRAASAAKGRSARRPH